MDDQDKLWVIGLGEDFTIEEAREKQSEIKRTPPRMVTPPKRIVHKVPAGTQARPTGRVHFALTLFLTYLLGPFALLLWPQGRRNPVWTGLSLFSGIGSLVLVLEWRRILAFDTNGSLLFPLLMAAAIISFLAFSTWARALHLAFASRTRSHTAWPAWMRTSWAVTGLGLIAPGLGLYLAGSRKRAVATLWSFWPVFLAVVVLVHAGWTWQWLRNSLHNSRSEVIFENLMLAAAAVLVLGTVGWLVQALAGLHRQRAQCQAGSTGSHGDRYAAALLVAVVALAIFAQPADMAVVFNDAGTCLYEQGYRTIPLELARSAYKLDPGETAYGLQVAILHQELGDTAEAALVQRDLDQNYGAYIGMFGRKAPAAGPAVAPVVQSAPLPPLAAEPETAPILAPQPWASSLTFSIRDDLEKKPVLR